MTSRTAKISDDLFLHSLRDSFLAAVFKNDRIDWKDVSILIVIADSFLIIIH